MNDPQRDEEGIWVTINGRPVTNPLTQMLALLGMGAFGLFMALFGIAMCVGVILGLAFAVYALVALLPATFPVVAVIFIAFVMFMAGYAIVLLVGDLALRGLGLNGFQVSEGRAHLNINLSGTTTYRRKLRVSRNAFRRRVPTPDPAGPAD